MIQTDGKPTIANRIPLDPPSSDPVAKRDEELDEEIAAILREAVYEKCRCESTDTFEWLACFEREFAS